LHVYAAKEKVWIGSEPQEPEYSEYSKRSYQFYKIDVKRDSKQRDKKHRKCGQNSYQVEDTVNIYKLLEPVFSGIKPCHIFNDKKQDNYHFGSLYQSPGCFRNRIGFYHQNSADNYIQEDDNYINGFSKSGFAINQIKLDCFPKTVRHCPLFSYGQMVMSQWVSQGTKN